MIKVNRFFIHSNPNIIFVYGESYRAFSDYADDVQECRGEPNAYGISTCICFDLQESDRIFKPTNWDIHKWNILEEIKEIQNVSRDRVVYALSKLGKGQSLMLQKTPDYYNWMIKELKKHVPQIEFL